MNYHNIQFETSFGISAQLTASDLPEVVFAGRSNVGKSSMINKLFNRRQLARVSSSPGKTATINFFKADNIRFVDLPGYGYAKVSKGEKHRWSELMEGYFAQERDLRLVFLLVDMRHTPSSDDLAMVNFLIDRELPFIVVLTKADKLKKSQRDARLAELVGELPCGDQIHMIPFSSQTGEGVEDIKSVVAGLEEELDEELAHPYADTPDGRKDD